MKVLSYLMLQLAVNRVLGETKSEILTKVTCDGGIWGEREGGGKESEEKKNIFKEISKLCVSNPISYSH